MGSIEALYIFDEHNNPILEHVYKGRPPAARDLLPLYLAHPDPRPSLLYLPSTNPATLVFSIIQDRLLFLATSNTDVEPLLVLELLHRVADALEVFLHSPLLASKLESSYDVVAQLLSEMCDGGLIATTEPNTLQDLVAAPSWMNKLLGGVGLPSTSPSLTTPSSTPSLPPSRSSSPIPSTIPWRRPNVRHTSNELYVDLVESVSVLLAPSGRPLSAHATGTLAFTAKVSGVPELNLILSGPGSSLADLIPHPTFHPCVRLGRWKERPGALSFVPPDGRFILMGYVVDLLGDPLAGFASGKRSSAATSSLPLPATVQVRTGLGDESAGFEVRLRIHPHFARGTAYTSLKAQAGRTSATAASGPVIDELCVRVPLPAGVRRVAELSAAGGVGEVTYAPGDAEIVWRVSGREVRALMERDRGVGAVEVGLRGVVVGDAEGEEEVEEEDQLRAVGRWEYDEHEREQEHGGTRDERPGRRGSRSRSRSRILLMPRAATLSFQTKGWLPSGIRVESLTVDPRRSRGLGAGVSPYKGVKYVCVSEGGVECRC